MAKFTIYIFMLVMSFSAAANIRVIGNGGGYGEMQALSIFSELSLFATPCARPENPCGLEMAEQLALKQLYSQTGFSTRELTLSFPERTPDGTAFTVTHSAIQIAARELYDGDDQEAYQKSYAAIAPIVFEAWLAWAESVYGPLLISKAVLAGKIFDGLKVDEFNWEMTEEGVTGHIVNIVSSRYDHWLVGLEFDSHSVDITDHFLAQIPCALKPTKISIERVFYDRDRLLGWTTWTCEGHTARAQFIAAFDLTDSHRPKVDLNWVTRTSEYGFVNSYAGQQCANSLAK